MILKSRLFDHFRSFESRTVMTALLSVAIISFSAITAPAQWSTPDGQGNINSTNTGKVGIGTTAPNSKLTVSSNAAPLPSPTMPGTTLLQFSAGDASNTRLLIDSFAAVPAIDFRRANTSASSPSSIFLDDNIGQISWLGRGSTGYGAGVRASFRSSAAENWSDTAQGTYLSFSTTTKTTLSVVERLRISDSGNVGIGTIAPTQNLDVAGNIVATGSQTSTTANKGVIEVTNTITNNATSAAAFRARNTFNGNGAAPAGLDVVPTFAPTATVSLARGGVIGGFFAPPSGVTINDVFGLNAVTAYNNSSGAVTTGSTLVASIPIVLGTLKPTNQIGLNVLNQGISGSTNSYGIYVKNQSGSTNSYAAVFEGGDVGIGTPTPTKPLDVVGEIRSTLGFRFSDGTLQNTASFGTISNVTAGSGLTGGGTTGGITLDISTGTGLSVVSDSISVNYGSSPGTAVQGNTTITVAPGDGISGGGPLTLGAGGTLTLTNEDRGSAQSIFKNVANAAGTTQFSAGSNSDSISFAGAGGTSVTFDTTAKKITIDGSTATPAAANISSGQFGQNTGGGNYTFPGNVTVNGVINAKYQDVAEWVPSTLALPAGTVVTLDPTKSNHVEASSIAYDTRVAGVVSAQPGIALGEKRNNKVLVATTGRVKVMVDASAGPIGVGDLLVTSDIDGVAMKSEPVQVGKRSMHMPGTLIGKALEPLAKGRGEILVLLSLQ